MQFRGCITNINLSSALMFLYKEVLTSSQVLSSECQREFSQMSLTFSPKRRFASNKRRINFEVHHAGWSTISKILREEIGRFLINPLNPELNPICYLLELLGAYHFLHVSRIRVKLLTFRLLMSYIYMEHSFLMFLDHTQRRSTVGRTPLDE